MLFAPNFSVVRGFCGFCRAAIKAVHADTGCQFVLAPWNLAHDCVKFGSLGSGGFATLFLPTLVASASDLEFAFWALPHTVLAVVEPWVGLAPSVEQIRVLGEIRVLASTFLDLCVGSKIRVAIGDRRNWKEQKECKHFLLRSWLWVVPRSWLYWHSYKFLKSKGINRKNKIEIQRSDIGFFNYLKYLADESKAENWVKRRVTVWLVFWHTLYIVRRTGSILYN